MNFGRMLFNSVQLAVKGQNQQGVCSHKVAGFSMTGLLRGRSQGQFDCSRYGFSSEGSAFYKRFIFWDPAVPLREVSLGQVSSLFSHGVPTRRGETWPSGHCSVSRCPGIEGSR